ncbi:hypothetical protein ACOJ08_15125, partial [Ornithinimicrobium sp. Y1847]
MAKKAGLSAGGGGASARPVPGEGQVGAAASGTLAGQVREFATALVGADLTGLSDDDRLELLRSLEDLSRSVAGVGARVQVA